jgi:para-aminobenzoate synthetase component 1
MADGTRHLEVGRAAARRLSSAADVGAVVARATTMNEAIVLDSAGGDRKWGRWTVIGFDPIDRVEVADGSGPNPFDTLNEQVEGHCVRPLESALEQGPPCCGGWMGYIGYEAGSFLERVPVNRPARSGLPWVRFGLYDAVLAYDHVEAQWWASGIDWRDKANRHRPCLDDRFWILSHWLDGVSAPSRESEIRAVGFRADLSQSQYEARVLRAIEYIGAGDVYQVNFAQTFRARWPGHAGGLYRRLRESNPGGYAAYYGWDDRAVLSSSPELFLQLQDDQVVTRPIKGTRPRSIDPVVDMSYWSVLLNSEKDQAELAMIIDLERNDLGRVCEFGSVRVTERFGLEAHPTVYHLVGTVEGRLRREHGAVDLLRATFPGGSITGAPKIRAMEIIDELEPCQRGVYCGSIGWIGLDGTMTMNIAIRTMTYAGGEVSAPVGSGIVADSIPEDEYEETLAKGRGMFRALGAEDACFAKASSGTHA